MVFMTGLELDQLIDCDWVSVIHENIGLDKILPIL